MNTKWLKILLTVSIITLIISYFIPINSFIFRSIFLASLISTFIFLLILFWNKFIIRNLVLTLILSNLAMVIIPGKRFNTDNVKNAYLANLKNFEGSTYVWGGENKIGIDCSGLLRASYIKAMWSEGIKTLNSTPIKHGISQWWHDRTAKMMKKEYRGETKRITSAKSINEVDYNLIQPGDMAVTKNGIHVLAFLGDKKWIQAHPSEGEVVINHVPSADPWLNTPVEIMRWTIFQ